MENVGAKVTPAWAAFSFRGESYEGFLNALEGVQALLPVDKPFAVGDEFTNADIAVAPFLGRMYLMLKHGIGKFSKEDGQRVWDALHSEKFARLTKYASDLMARESFKKTFDEVCFPLIMMLTLLSLRMSRHISRARWSEELLCCNSRNNIEISKSNVHMTKVEHSVYFSLSEMLFYYI